MNSLEEKKKEKKGSDKILFFSVIFLIIIFAIILSVRFLHKGKKVATIDELHLLNIEGKLKPEQGYIYNGYSFVFVDGLWYTQIQSTSGRYLFDVPLHYGPRDVGDIPIEGWLNDSIFNSQREIFITFNPLEPNLKYVALAIGEFDQNIIKTFDKIPIAACDRNETKPCKSRPIIRCNNTREPVFYAIQEEPTKIILKDNCIIVQGVGYELVRAVDRLLLWLYGIMERNNG